MQRGGRHRDEVERHAEADEQHRRQDVREVGRVVLERREPEQARRAHHQARHHERLGADPREQLAGDAGADDDPDAEREEGEAGRDRREALDDLQPQAEEEEHREQADADDERHEVGRPAVAVEQHAHGHERVRDPVLDDEEAHQHDDREAEPRERGRLGPVGRLLERVRRRLREAVDQGDEADRDRDGTEDVVLRGAVGTTLPHERDGQEHGDDRDRDVDQQAPAPREVLGEDAAEEQAERGAAAGDRTVDAERAGALLGLVEGHGDERQGRGSQQRREGTLEATCREQQGGGGRCTAERGGAGEADEADDERALAADVVGDPAAEEEETAEGQGVRRDDPLLVGVGDAEGRLRRRDREVHDRGVEDDHELRDADDQQGAPAQRVERDAGGRQGPAVRVGRDRGGGRLERGVGRAGHGGPSGRTAK